MKLSNLDMYANMRITQADGGEETQALDIEFDMIKNASIHNDVFTLAFYGMLNGYVTGVDGGSAVTGFKFVGYDENDTMIMETAPIKLDMVVDEASTRFEAIASINKPDSTVAIYLTKIDIVYVANNEGVSQLTPVLTSTSPASNVFSEIIGATTKKGIMIQGGQSTTFTGKFYLTFKN